MRSRITLVDADPSAKSPQDGGFLSAMSPSHIN
ncbi:hypothetical protein Avbf_14766 [Armadillidium vulgare]|nr:hypothetical protein Avbf_14766 [Armadillidium vulgare]